MLKWDTDFSEPWSPNQILNLSLYFYHYTWEQVYIRSSTLLLVNLHTISIGPFLFKVRLDKLSWDLPLSLSFLDHSVYLWLPPHGPACGWLFMRSSSLPLVASTWPSLRMTSASALFRQMISSSCCWTFFSRQSTRWHSSPWSWLNSPSVTP